MTTDSSKVKLAVTGSIAIARVGTPGPVDARTPLTSQWLSLGFITEDGVKEIATSSPTEIVPWRSSRATRVCPGIVSVKYQFSMLETNTAAVSLFYGEDVKDQAEWHHAFTPGKAKDYAVVLTFVDGDAIVRKWLPRAEVMDRGERVASATSAPAMDVTLVAYPAGDLMGDGVSAQAVTMYSDPLQPAGLAPAPPQIPVPATGDYGSGFGADFG